MNPGDWLALGVSLACAILASVLVGVETALSSMSKSRAEQMVDDGVRGAARIEAIVSDPARSINAVRFARTLFEIATIALVALLVFDWLDQAWARVLATVGIMVVVSFIMWGVAPRTLGRQRAERVLRSSSWLVSLLAKVLGPIAQLMILIGNALTPGKGFAEGPFASESELRDLVDIAEANELIEARESRMIHSVFELGDTLVKEVMVPRTDMVFIPQERTLRQLLSLALRSGFSRIPVVGEGIDDVLGAVYLKDVTKRIYDYPDSERTETVGSLMRPVTFVPDSKAASELLRDMQLSHSHLVIVVDEFGGTAGLATMEDIVEEIVGEIVDEYDNDVEAVEEVEPGLYRVSSRMPLDDLSELFDQEIDDEDVETVAGLMAKQLNLVPIPGSTTVHDGIEMTADRAVGRRHQIGTVLVRRVVTPDSPTEVAEDD